MSLVKQNGRYWKILIKNIERNILNLTQNFPNDSKINLKIQIIPARHSFPWKTTFWGRNQSLGRIRSNSAYGPSSMNNRRWCQSRWNGPPPDTHFRQETGPAPRLPFWTFSDSEGCIPGCVLLPAKTNVFTAVLQSHASNSLRLNETHWSCFALPQVPGFAIRSTPSAWSAK